MKWKLLNFWKPGIWLIIICYLSLMPANEFPRISLFNFPGFDKLVHFGFYFILSLFLFKPFSKVLTYPVTCTIVTAALAGGLIEILQKEYTTSRHADVFDFLADLAGILAAVIFYILSIRGRRTERYF